MSLFRYLAILLLGRRHWERIIPALLAVVLLGCASTGRESVATYPMTGEERVMFVGVGADALTTGIGVGFCGLEEIHPAGLLGAAVLSGVATWWLYRRGRLSATYESATRTKAAQRWFGWGKLARAGANAYLIATECER